MAKQARITPASKGTIMKVKLCASDDGSSSDQVWLKLVASSSIANDDALGYFKTFIP